MSKDPALQLTPIPIIVSVSQCMATHVIMSVIAVHHYQSISPSIILRNQSPLSTCLNPNHNYSR